MKPNVKVINRVLCIKENGKYRPFSPKELTDLLLDVIEAFAKSLSQTQSSPYRCASSCSQTQSSSKPIEVYRCARSTCNC